MSAERKERIIVIRRAPDESYLIDPMDPPLRESLLSQGAADLLTAASNVIFAVALLPTVLATTILPIASSAATLVALLMLGVVLAHFRLWWGLVWNIICAGMWATLLIMAL